jgi:hypothetical protein
MGDRLSRALRALSDELAGRTPNSGDAQELRDIERFTGAKRRLADYAPSTRRRYIAAARRYDRRPNRTEYVRRKNQQDRNRVTGVTADQWRKIKSWARRNEEALNNNPDNDVSFDDETMRDLVTMYGVDFALEVLKEQWESIRAWEKSDQIPGPKQKGNARYFGDERRKRETRYMRMTGQGAFGNTDPFYYYHGTRG